MKQEGCEFKASLSYIAFLVLKEKKIHPTILKQFLLQYKLKATCSHFSENLQVIIKVLTKGRYTYIFTPGDF
jgi:hypothetical protein